LKTPPVKWKATTGRFWKMENPLFTVLENGALLETLLGTLLGGLKGGKS
jgi:hypothetical protein